MVPNRIDSYHTARMTITLHGSFGGVDAWSVPRHQPPAGCKERVCELNFVGVCSLASAWRLWKADNPIVQGDWLMVGIEIDAILLCCV